MKLNLGCGQKKMDGYTNVDKYDTFKPGICSLWISSGLWTCNITGTPLQTFIQAHKFPIDHHAVVIQRHEVSLPAGADLGNNWDLASGCIGESLPFHSPQSCPCFLSGYGSRPSLGHSTQKSSDSCFHRRFNLVATIGYLAETNVSEG